MARGYYRRRYTNRYYGGYKKKNWSSNIITSQTTITFPASTNYGGGSAICLNPIQSVSTVSQPFTVKNIKLSVSCVASEVAISSALDNIIVAIVYVPQGYAVTYNTLSEHQNGLWLLSILIIQLLSSSLLLMVVNINHLLFLLDLQESYRLVTLFSYVYLELIQRQLLLLLQLDSWLSGGHVLINLLLFIVLV